MATKSQLLHALSFPVVPAPGIFQGEEISAAAGSQLSEAPRKRGLPRDVHRAVLGSWREREWSSHPEAAS